jgi:hypothetical protein
MADQPTAIATEPTDSFPPDGSPDVQTSRKASREEPYRKGEAEVVEFIEGLYTDAEQSKHDQCAPDTWGDDLATYWGDQWSGAIPSYKPRIVVNEIKSLLLQELSDLTDSRITIYVQKDRASEERDANVERSIQAFWKRRFCDLTVLSAALDAMIFPLGFLQTVWLPGADQGQGEVGLIARDPSTVFPDGDAVDDDDLRFYILEDVLDIVQIRRDWPETGWRVQPEGNYSIKREDAKARPAPRAGSQYTGPLYAQTMLGGVPGYKKARASVKTCVIDDDDEIEEINSIAGELRQVKRFRYPHRRMIQVANRRVLYDEDCPYHYAPMLTRVALQPSVHSYWPAVSLVNEFGEIQSTANKMDSMVAENGLRLNAGEVFADADSGLSPKTYGGIPGMVYLIKPGSKVVKQYPNAMPADMVGAGERFRGFIRTTLGYPTSRTGAGTRGNVAAELAETEISQAMGLTRLRGRLLYQAVQRSVEMIFARMAQFYTTPRRLPFVEDGLWKTVKWEPLVTPEAYAVHVDENSFQIRSKTMMQRLALALAKMGKMPTGRLLKILEIPDAEAIAKELKDELALIAAAKAKPQRGRAR